MNELALFAGAGGGVLAGKLLGWRTVCAVEIDPYCRSILFARQRDGIIEPFPIWDDVATFDGLPWFGRVDLVSGGFPCQDISASGKGAGIGGKRSGLWSHMARIIGEVQPRYVLVENSPVLVSRGLDWVLSDLALLGYNARWGVIGANDAGAPHIRRRIWVVGFTDRRDSTSPVPYTDGDRIRQCAKRGPGGPSQTIAGKTESTHDGPEKSMAETQSSGLEISRKRLPGGTNWWAAEPGMGRVADGVAHRMDRLKALGNGQVPAVVRLAFQKLIA